MRKPLLTVIITIALLLIGLSILRDNSTNNNRIDYQSSATEELDSQQELVLSTDGKTISYAGVAGEDALTTLQALAEVETEESEFGSFVISINGLAADSSSEFWAFYVNSTQASVGAGEYISADGDVVEWKIESFQ